MRYLEARHCKFAQVEECLPVIISLGIPCVDNGDSARTFNACVEPVFNAKAEGRNCVKAMTLVLQMPFSKQKTVE